MSLDVRLGEPEDLPSVMNVVDGAMLALDSTTAAERLDAGAVLVAVEDGRTLGTCVVDAGDAERESGAAASAHVEALAVRPQRRGQGVGSALVAAAADRWGSLSAEFDGDLRPFYESLGFEVESVGGDRFRGVRPLDA